VSLPLVQRKRSPHICTCLRLFLEALRGYGLQFLKTQHDFFAKHFGILPEVLQKKLGDFSVIKQNINGYYYSQEGGA